MNEQLPDGLQLAVALLGGDRAAFICSHIHPVNGLAPSDEEIATEYLTAIGAIRAEHAQRLTLQHHACDQAQRITDLEAERDALRARLAEIEAQEPIFMVEMTTAGSRLLRYNPDAKRLPERGMTLYARPVPAQAVPDADGARFRWLCEDHSDRETREQCRSLIDRLSGMSYSAAVMSIDAAMAAAPEYKA